MELPDCDNEATGNTSGETEPEGESDVIEGIRLSGLPLTAGDANGGFFQEGLEIAGGDTSLLPSNPAPTCGNARVNRLTDGSPPLVTRIGGGT